MAALLKYYSFTFINVQKRQVVGIVSTDPGDAWAQLGIKLGSMMLRGGFQQSGAGIYLGEFPPGTKLTPRDQQIGQQ